MFWASLLLGAGWVLACKAVDRWSASRRGWVRPERCEICGWRYADKPSHWHGNVISNDGEPPRELGEMPPVDEWLWPLTEGEKRLPMRQVVSQRMAVAERRNQELARG